MVMLESGYWVIWLSGYLVIHCLIDQQILKSNIQITR